MTHVFQELVAGAGSVTSGDPAPPFILPDQQRTVCFSAGLFSGWIHADSTGSILCRKTASDHGDFKALSENRGVGKLVATHLYFVM